jgi:hypothetical protein
LKDQQAVGRQAELAPDIVADIGRRLHDFGSGVVNHPGRPAGRATCCLKEEVPSGAGNEYRASAEHHHQPRHAALHYRGAQWPADVIDAREPGEASGYARLQFDELVGVDDIDSQAAELAGEANGAAGEVYEPFCDSTPAATEPWPARAYTVHLDAALRGVEGDACQF